MLRAGPCRPLPKMMRTCGKIQGHGLFVDKVDLRNKPADARLPRVAYVLAVVRR